MSTIVIKDMPDARELNGEEMESIKGGFGIMDALSLVQILDEVTGGPINVGGMMDTAKKQLKQKPA